MADLRYERPTVLQSPKPRKVQSKRRVAPKSGSGGRSPNGEDGQKSSSNVTQIIEMGTLEQLLLLLFATLGSTPIVTFGLL